MPLDERFTPHMPRLYRAAAQVLRHHQDSEDALQEGLMAAFCHLDQFQGRAKFSTWLHRIVVNAALMKLRSRKQEIRITTDDSVEGDVDLNFEFSLRDNRPTPEEEYGRIERSRMLLSAIRELPAKYRIVLQLCDLDGLMEREAAQTLGAPVHVVKSRRFRGRKMLYKRLRCKSVRSRASWRTLRMPIG
jgi:RNA polymerase sigma-70 factor (ECF subfamily)